VVRARSITGPDEPFCASTGRGWAVPSAGRAARGWSRSGRQVSRGIAWGHVVAPQGIVSAVAALLQLKVQDQRSAVTERLGDRECGLPLSGETRGSGGGIRARIGHQVWDGFTLPQVTGLALARLKIVKVFEFMPLASAPGRIRTCAHGSGGRCCAPL